VVEGSGPNTINHDNVQRRIVVMANTSGRDLGSVVDAVRQRVGAEVKLPTGYFLSYEGQFESQQSATRLIAVLSLFSLVGMFLVLYAHFRSVTLVLQVMLNVPLALVGSVAAVLLTTRTLSVATLVGFITLCGIASRNTIMMISHYLHLVEVEGERFGQEMVVRGSLERLVPVMMTALTAGLALVPLALAAGAPGKEILHPVAVVILGGLVSSTLLDMAVTPAVFYRFGRPALEKYLARKKAAREEGILPGVPEGSHA
jgi:HME family heavy-metal exporter